MFLLVSWHSHLVVGRVENGRQNEKLNTIPVFLHLSKEWIFLILSKFSRCLRQTDKELIHDWVLSLVNEIAES